MMKGLCSINLVQNKKKQISCGQKYTLAQSVNLFFSFQFDLWFEILVFEQS